MAFDHPYFLQLLQPLLVAPDLVSQFIQLSVLVVQARLLLCVGVFSALINTCDLSVIAKLNDGGIEAERAVAERAVADVR